MGVERPPPGYFGVADGAFSDPTVGLVLPWRIGRWATVRASVHWSSFLDDTVCDVMQDPDNLWFGVRTNLSL